MPSYAAMIRLDAKSSLSMFRARHTGCSLAATSGAWEGKEYWDKMGWGDSWGCGERDGECRVWMWELRVR